MRYTIYAVGAHEVSGQQVMKGGGAHLLKVIDDPARLFRGKFHPLKAFQETDVLKSLITNTRLIINSELPAL